ncbi:hypothetical protein EYV94_00815 [Puteibacter caeruleilacunae]|nr:hypothetical protein EYV94_00815 [Puteibacter caeruleilacunae]
MSKSVFISYRRATNEEQGYKRFADHIRDVLGYFIQEDELFFDQKTLLPGDVFSDELKDNASNCKAFIMLINKNWEESFSQKKANGQADFVLEEILCALNAPHNVVFFPLLVNRGNQVPKLEDLPEELQQHPELWQHHVHAISDEFPDLRSSLKVLGEAITYKFPTLTTKQLPFQSYSIDTLGATDLMGERGKLENKFNESIYYYRDVDTIIMEEFQQEQYPKILIHGKSMAGKTRSVYHFLKESLIQINASIQTSIYIFNEKNIGHFIDYFKGEIKENLDTDNIIIVLDELYKCFSRVNKQDFETAFSNICTKSFKLITTCTTAEYQRMQEYAKQHSSIIWNNIDSTDFKTIMIEPLTREQFHDITKQYGFKTPKGDTIGELLGVNYPWNSYNDTDQDGLTREVLKAIQNLGYIKRWGVDIDDIISYLNEKANDTMSASEFRRSKMIQIPDNREVSFRPRHLEAPLQVLCDSGILYPVDSIDEDTELIIDEDYRDKKIRQLPYKEVKNNILDFYMTNKNLARLIVQDQADNKSREQLFKRRLQDEENLNWVINAYCRTTKESFEESLEFYEKTGDGEANFDFVSLRSLASKCETEEQANFILKQAEQLVDTEEADDPTLFIPRKIDILNQLLTVFPVDTLCKQHPNYNGNNDLLEDYYTFNEITHINIIKHLSSNRQIFNYYESNNIQGSSKVISHLVSHYSWTLKQYKRILGDYMLHANLPAKEMKDEALLLLNKAITNAKEYIDGLYNWGKEHLEIDTITLNLYLMRTEHPWPILKQLKEDRTIKNIILLNTCINQSKTFEDAKTFFLKIPAPDDRSFNFLGNKIKDKHSYEEVIDLMTKHTYIHYEFALASLIKKRAKMQVSSTDIYSELFESDRLNFTLNNVMVSELINTASSYKEVLDLVNKARKRGLQPDLDLYSNLIQAERRFKEEVLATFSEDELEQHIRNRLAQCKQFTPHIYLYRAVLYNELYANYHEQYFKQYVDSLLNDDIEFDELVIKNYTSNTQGFFTIQEKLSRVSHLINKLANYFFERNNNITSYADIEAITEFFKHHNRTLPGKLISNIIEFRRNNSEHVNIVEELIRLDNQHLLKCWDMNLVIHNSDLVPKNQEYDITKQVIDHFSQPESRIKPDAATYSYLITACKNYQEALDAYNAFQRSGLSPNHRVFINLLNKVEDLGTLKKYFSEFEELFLNEHFHGIKQKDINSIFNKWYELVEKLPDEKRKIKEREERKYNEKKHGFRAEEYRLSHVCHYEFETVKETLDYIRESDYRNTTTYNSIFRKCKTANDAIAIYDSVMSDYKAEANITTISNLFYRVTTLEEGNNHFHYFGNVMRTFEQKTSFNLSKTLISLKKSQNNKNSNNLDKFKNTINTWLSQCSSLDQYKEIIQYFPDNKIDQAKKPWEQKWYREVIASIDTANQAIFFFEHLGNWKGIIQVQALENQISDLSEKFEFNTYIKNEHTNMAIPWLYGLENIQEFRAMFKEYRRYQITISKNSLPWNQKWYHNVIGSIDNLDDAIFVFEHLGTWKRYPQVYDVVKQIEFAGDREAFFKHFNSFLRHINFRKEMMEKLVYQGA